MQTADGHPKPGGRRAATAIAALLVIGSGAIACTPAAPPGSMVEPMELQGRWLGMRLVATDSTTARELGVPQGISGVVVAELEKMNASRATQAGLSTGDVVVSVDATRVLNLADLYALTKGKNVAQPIGVDILRRGQPMSLILAAPLGAGMAPMAAAQSAVEATASGAPLFCPNDGLHWTPAQVSPDMRCPRCGGPLLR